MVADGSRWQAQERISRVAGWSFPFSYQHFTPAPDRNNLVGGSHLFDSRGHLALVQGGEPAYFERLFTLITTSNWVRPRAPFPLRIRCLNASKV